ncbi:MAG TPA: TonB-dependent receptor [Gemmatimonadaceae bacterium]|nr:TonB-dependent receptor [Gemmatimonadaceae bacterium]
MLHPTRRPRASLALAAPVAPVALLAVLALAAPAARAQGRAGTPLPSDSAQRDSTGVQPLPEVSITVTRDDQPLSRVPWAVGVAGVRELRAGQPTIGLDEALGGIPGVLVGNRYNFALDQRLAIRGFGSRANFGVRGVVVLLDGIPQTLPDGQSQLTNVELGAIDRVEVLRGSSSSLYGNGSGGVVSFTSDLLAPDPLRQSVRAEAGSFGLAKWQARTAGRHGRAGGMLSVSRLSWEGFREYSAADSRQLNAGVDYALGPATTASLRLALADLARAENPGALTAEEFAADPSAAAPNNIRRGADKRTRQDQLSLRVRRESAPDGVSFDASVYGLTRDLRNAIAAAPPPPAAPENGTYITIDRAVYGARASATLPLAGAGGPRLTAGAEWQRMRDARQNRRSTAGRPSAPADTLLLDQVETTWSLGPFAQLLWDATPRLTLSAGGRYDRVHFDVRDRFLSDGRDDGDRVLPAWSGHLGATYVASEAFAPYANLSTSFETPTTTELQERADDLGGFNDALGPQRALTTELGARGSLWGRRVTYSAALFRAHVSDAIVQYEETNGRAYFRNAGATRNDGAELGLGVRASDALGVDVAYTWSHYRFTDYRVVSGDAVDVLDGKRLPGVPEHFLRVGLRTRPTARTSLDLDHTVSSFVYADDDNTQRVAGWGAGITDARATWSARVGRTEVQPFVGVRNLFDRRYVSSVVVNGFGGRVREPGPGRNWYLGAEIGVRVR